MECVYKKLKNDRRHITYKLHQTLNFLYGASETDIYNINEGKDKYINIDKFSSIEVSEYYKSEDKIYRLPPPIFYIDIYANGGEGDYDISKKSSGQKQLMSTISVILYYMRNLDSVHNEVESKQEKSRILKYKNINLVLDEIELYFHPEYQRKFIYGLLNGIKIMNFPHIENINILLATHSPFILSDIPRRKILFLDEGGTASGVQDETFGANIHSMLKHSFFIEGMPIGEFARNKIKDIIEKINSSSEKDYNEIEKEISLIGEPIIRRELKRQLDEKNKILDRIIVLENELQILKKQINNATNNSSKS